MSRISIIHPSRSRPHKSIDTIGKWLSNAFFGIDLIEVIVVIDSNDPDKDSYVKEYSICDPDRLKLVMNTTSGSVNAINLGATIARYDVLMVVSDDTHCFGNWDVALLNEVEDKTDWILKTQDGIQPWIITMPVMDRVYFNRTGHIYHPGFEHMFCDTWMSVMADVTGRRITSNLLFPHLNDSIKDDVRKKTDATWAQGEKTFINLCKSLPKEDLRKIKDQSMINWLRNKGVR